MRSRARHQPCSQALTASRRRSHVRGVCLILGVGLLAFVSVCWHEFVWEDYHYIANNASLRALGNIPSFSGSGYWQTKHPLKGGLYRPLPMVSYAIDYAFWRPDAKGYHVTNLLCHLLVSALVYAACLGLSPSRRVALVAGLIFAVHPVHAEPAAWVKCREELLAAVGILVSFVAFRRSLGAGQKWGTGWWLASLLAAIAAYLCKQNALVLPAVLSGYLWYARAAIGREHRRAAVAKLAPHWLVALGLAFWCAAPSSATSQPHHAPHPGMGVILTTALTYLRLTFLPIHLNAYREVQPILRVTMAQVAGAAVAVYVAAQILCGGRRPAFWVCWAAVFFLPVSNIVFLSGRPIAEQRLYLPSLAFCAIVGLAVEAGVRQARRTAATPAMALALPLAWLVASAPLAIHRNLAWSDNYSLWTDTMRCSPGSAGAAQEMGLAYAEQEQWARALRLLLRARRLNPESRDLPHNIAGVLIQQGRSEEAARYLREATELAPRLALARKLEAQGKTLAAREAYRAVLRIDGENVQAKAGLRRLGEEVTER